MHCLLSCAQDTASCVHFLPPLCPVLVYHSKARRKAEAGVLNALGEAIEQAAEKGLSSLDLDSYDVKLTEEMKQELEDKGYQVASSMISW